MAEFERAIYRVYERCLEGLQDDDNEAGVNVKSCKAFEVIALTGGTFFFLVLVFLHISFVGRPGCLGRVLEERAAALNLSSSALRHDQVLQIRLDRRYAPNVDESGADSLKGSNNDDAAAGHDGRRRRTLENRPPLARRRRTTTMLLPFPGPISWATAWWRPDPALLPGPPPPPPPPLSSPAPQRALWQADAAIRGLRARHRGAGGNPALLATSHVASTPTTTTTTTTIAAAAAVAGNGTKNGNSSAPAVVTYSRGTYDFEFAYDVGLLALPDEMLFTHHFDIVNVTLAGSQCFGGVLSQELLPLGGIDTVVMNTLMYTLKKGGTLVSTTGDYYSWYMSDIYPYNSVVTWVGFKLGVLFSSLFAFFFLSSVTALLVRVLISSGVVVLFPMFWAMQCFGVQLINSRIISLSYPWIGVPMEMYRANQQSSVPFVLAHITRVVIYYSVYEASQLAFAEWFYGQGRPSQRELWLFAIMMLWEYYSMIYVRAPGSIALFPRGSLALFLLYHFYLFSHPSGFHLLALLVLFLYLTALMIFCVRKFEMEAFSRGVVNIDQPRALRNSLPWPTWAVALAPDYTLFMPVTVRVASLYQHVVPPPPPAAAAAAAATGGAAAAAAATGATTGGGGAGSNGGAGAAGGDVEMTASGRDRDAAGRLRNIVGAVGGRGGYSRVPEQADVPAQRIGDPANNTI